MRASALLGLVLATAACGAHAPAPEPDYGPPPQHVDPIACPAAMLEELAARIPGARLEVTLEPIVDAARIDKLPCAALADAACLARARQRPIPVGFEVASVTIGGEVTSVEFIYERDGRRVREEAPSLTAMVARLKALQAAGHAVRLIAGGSTTDAETRHAAIAYRPVDSPQRRVGTYRWRTPPDDHARAMAEAQRAAESTRHQLRSLEVVDDELVMKATCAGVVHAALPPDVSPGI